MSATQDELPPEFNVCLQNWRQAEQDAWLYLERYRTSPTQLTHLAIDAAWSALEVALGMLETWLMTHPRTRIASAVGDAQEALEELRTQIERAGLLEVWGRELRRH